jgi:hypothetical protein
MSDRESSGDEPDSSSHRATCDLAARWTPGTIVSIASFGLLDKMKALSAVSSAWAEALSSMTCITIQSLMDADIAPFMEVIARGHVRHLHIMRTNMTEVDVIRILQSSPVLETLLLSNAGTKDWDFSAFESGEPLSTSLHTFSYTIGMVGSRVLFGRLPNLRSIRFVFGLDSSVLPQSHATYGALESLESTYCPCEAEHVTELLAAVRDGQFHSLRIYQHSCDVWRRGIPSSARGLRTLELRGAQLTAADFAHVVQSLPHLQALHCSVANPSLESSSPHVRSDVLSRLALFDSTLNESDMLECTRRFPNVRDLDLTDSVDIPRDALACLTAFHQLRQLCICGLERTHEQAVDRMLPSMRALSVVVFYSFVRNEYIRTWATRFPHLTLIGSKMSTGENLARSFYEPTPLPATLPPLSLLCEDGTRIVATPQLVQWSSLLSSCVETEEEGVDVPLLHASSAALARAMEFCATISTHAMARLERPLRGGSVRPFVSLRVFDSICSTRHTMDACLALLHVANTLRIDPLFDLLCARIFEWIKDQPASCVRERLNIS